MGKNYNQNKAINLEKTSNESVVDDTEAETCTICMENIKPDSDISQCTAKKECTSKFHTDCIQGWLENGVSKTCPHCRADWPLSASVASPRPYRGGWRESSQNRIFSHSVEYEVDLGRYFNF